MRLEGRRDDGLQLVNLGAGICVILHAEGSVHSPSMSRDKADAYGPWKTATIEDNRTERRDQLSRIMHHARAVSMEQIMAVMTQKRNAKYRELVATMPAEVLDLKKGKDGAPAHPFTHCMETIIPAMEREGKAPDDPKAFCSWWKEEHAMGSTPSMPGSLPNLKPDPEMPGSLPNV